MGFQFSSGKDLNPPLSKAIEFLALQRLKNSKRGWVIASDDLKNYYQTEEEIQLRHSNGNSFFVEKIIGYSYDEWTPMVLILRDKGNKIVTNFIYMKGGKNEKGWHFVSSGIYGPNLWPDARKFLLGEIIKHAF